MAVSKPLRGAEPTGSSLSGLLPASTCQAATSVAPFQLTYSVTLSSGPRSRTAARAGTRLHPAAPRFARNTAQRYRCEGMAVEGQNEEPKVAQGNIDAHDDAPYAGEERAMQAPGLPEDARAAAAAGVRGGLIGGRDGRAEGPLIRGGP